MSVDTLNQTRKFIANSKKNKTLSALYIREQMIAALHMTALIAISPKTPK